MKIDFDLVFAGYDKELSKIADFKSWAKDRFLNNPTDPLSHYMLESARLGRRAGNLASGVYNLASGGVNTLFPPTTPTQGVSTSSSPAAATATTIPGSATPTEVPLGLGKKLQKFRAAAQQGRGYEFLSEEAEQLWNKGKAKLQQKANELKDGILADPGKALKDNAIPIGLTGAALAAYLYHRHKKKQKEEAKKQQLLQQQMLQQQQQNLLQRAAPQPQHQPHITIQNILPSQGGYQKYGSEKSADMVDALASSVGRRMVDKALNHAVSPAHPQEEHKEKHLEITSKYPEMEKMLKKKKNKEYLEKLLKD